MTPRRAVLLAASMAMGATCLSGCGSSPLASPDQGGRIAASEISVLDNVQLFAPDHVPWTATPCASCQWPATFAFKPRVSRDSCGTRATSGWGPVTLEAQIVWRRSVAHLVTRIGRRMHALGWVRGRSPSWVLATYAFTWRSRHGEDAPEVLGLSPDDGEASHHWLITIRVKPVGKMVPSGCV